MKWIECDKEMPPPGIPVLAYYETAYEKGRRIRAQFVPEKCISIDEMPFDEGAEYDEETDTCYWPSGWYEWNEEEETHWAVVCVVTHWMRLPDSPSNEKVQGAEHSEAPAAMEGSTQSFPGGQHER
jgi:hypothetical protein